MRDDLPDGLWNEECGLLNLDTSVGNGTHWTCWYKKYNICYYFDSFGLSPPLEFSKYMECDILNSTYQVQRLGDVVCGHLSFFMLYMLTVSLIPFHDALYYLL